MSATRTIQQRLLSWMKTRLEPAIHSRTGFLTVGVGESFWGTRDSGPGMMRLGRLGMAASRSALNPEMTSLPHHKRAIATTTNWVGRFLPNHSGSFDPIQKGQSNVQNYEVRLQFSCFLYCLPPIGHFGDSLAFCICRQDFANSRPPARKIIDENTRKVEMCHDSALARSLPVAHEADTFSGQSRDHLAVGHKAIDNHHYSFIRSILNTRHSENSPRDASLFPGKELGSAAVGQDNGRLAERNATNLFMNLE